MGDIIDFGRLEDLKKVVGAKRIVLAGGCFDILHFGHHTFLTSAKSHGDILAVALESDEFIRMRKHKKPVHTQSQRAEILASLNYVDYVIKLPLLKGYLGYMDFVRRLKPAIIAVSDGDTQLENKQKQALEVGAAVKIVCPQLKQFSSSMIVDYASFFGD